ncbi:interleukin-1 receptor type 1-like [Anabas testudineus]|uniref:Uncharacterized protein n=1 Tax=Anabas testudineus TaxID=64144 RepID=A0A3Q1H4U5_ANATE|nr:interleukin-1 receptor type 1-like [Anabas testudineus]
MAVTGWVYFLAAILSLAFARSHGLSGETETYYVSAGHLFLLKCLIPGATSNVTWSRGGRHNLSLPAGVEVREGLLWFLPVQMSHNGTYTCEKRDKSGFMHMTFAVSVSSGECPDAAETVTITLGVSGGLPCKQREIFKLNETKNIRWMKDCRPVQPLFVNKEGFMRLSAVSEKDAGKYTCLVDFSVDGGKYTAARSIEMTINNDIVAAEPEVVFPQNEVVIVEVGATVDLKCLALIGPSEQDGILMYWTVGKDFTDDYEELKESWEFIQDRGRVYARSILSISKVRHQFLNVPIHCYVSCAVGDTSGLVRLQEADHSVLYTTVALCFTAPLALLALGVVFLFFRVDLVLAYRKILRYVSKQQAPDGKLYDAYVSFLDSKTLSSAQTAHFVLQILPEELERKSGYSLYIRGRDDCPGEAFHDVIAAAVHQCRRLIIILSPDAKYSPDSGQTEEVSSTCGEQIQLCYEHKVGLHDALTQNDPRVILVEIDGPVDYRHLPESLCYIKRRQGALKWKTDSHATHKLIKLCSNRNFWKKLRYHMPSVPSERCQIID